MKKYLLAIFFTAMGTVVLAQATVKRSNDICHIVLEKFSVLKADKITRQGEYTATFSGETATKGTYTNGKRTGSWNFYGPNNKLAQTYNYDSDKLTFFDPNDLGEIKCIVAGAKTGDTVAAAIKIGGGRGLATIVLARTEVQSKMHDDMPNIIHASFIHTMVINAQGQVTDHLVKVIDTDDRSQTKTYHLDDSIFDPEITRFIPATINGKPTDSKVVATVTSQRMPSPMLHN
jgi:hypothetical protein